jgi:uncharacterized MAPEG superfamily protein
MTTDLWMLVWSAVLCLVTPYPGVTALLTRVPGGPAWGFGNRDTTIEVPAWILRGRRAHANMVENLVPFACLVLVAHVAGKANAATAFAAQLFFWSRLLYALVYLAGIPYLRTVVFSAGALACFMIVFELLG